MICLWDSGYVTCSHVGDDEFLIYRFVASDSYGDVAATERYFTLPREAVEHHADAFVHFVEHFRDGAPLAGPYRWDLTQETRWTLVADHLVDEFVADAQPQCHDDFIAVGDVYCAFDSDPPHRLVLYTKVESDIDAEWYPPRSALETPRDTARAIAQVMLLPKSGQDPFVMWGVERDCVLGDFVAGALAEGWSIRFVDWVGPDTHGPGTEVACEVSMSTSLGDLVALRYAAESQEFLVYAVTALDVMHGSGSGAYVVAVLVDLPDLTPGAVQLHVFQMAEEVVSWSEGPVESDHRPGLYGSTTDFLDMVYLEGWAAENMPMGEPVVMSRPAPVPRLIRSADDAEAVAAEWMTWMGYADCAVTPRGADGGVDVVSATAVAQVKAETIPVGRPPLQKLYGVASARKVDGLFFSLSGYTRTAVAWADEVALPLFEFDLQGLVVPANDAAEALMSGC